MSVALVALFTVLCALSGVCSSVVPRSMRDLAAKGLKSNGMALLTIGSFAQASRGVESSNLDVFDEVWLREEPDFGPGSFGRLDEKDDAKYYEVERFVEHIDERALNGLTNYHDMIIAKESKEQGRSLDVLDLCSSWTSHVSSSASGEEERIRSLWGLGMVSSELAANKLLTKRTVHDLNTEPRFAPSVGDNSLDIVLLQLSVDYLTRPVEVFQEVGRLLRPGGSCHVSFSNRVFIDKVVGIWSGKSDEEHCEIVGDYFKASRAFVLPPAAIDVIRVVKPKGKGKDPLYVVTAKKKSR